MLRGYGREPYGTDTSIQMDDITEASGITHRWDLLEADQQKPWVPKVVEGNGNPHGYVPLDPTVGRLDPHTRTVFAANGNHGRTYALAVLSVGDKAATWPVVFEPKRSYVAKSLRVVAPLDAPQVRVLGFNAASLQAPTQPPPSAPPPPLNTTLQLPGPPTLPSFPTAAAPPVVPPVPPAPPPPPGGQHALPLNPTIGLVGVAVPPTTGVTAQPTPPVNPSPPSGARKEAKQHQASAAKSEEGGAQKASDAAGDLNAQPGPPGGLGMSRRDRIKPAPAGFTPLSRAHAEQPSAWTTGLQWGGGIGLMALVLAFGYITAWPTPRSRLPVVPAPAWLRRRR
jgi:hypothetical protein